MRILHFLYIVLLVLLHVRSEEIYAGAKALSEDGHIKIQFEEQDCAYGLLFSAASKEDDETSDKIYKNLHSPQLELIYKPWLTVSTSSIIVNETHRALICLEGTLIGIQLEFYNASVGLASVSIICTITHLDAVKVHTWSNNQNINVVGKLNAKCTENRSVSQFLQIDQNSFLLDCIYKPTDIQIPLEIELTAKGSETKRHQTTKSTPSRKKTKASKDKRVQNFESPHILFKTFFRLFQHQIEAKERDEMSTGNSRSIKKSETLRKHALTEEQVTPIYNQEDHTITNEDDEVINFKITTECTGNIHGPLMGPSQKQTDYAKEGIGTSTTKKSRTYVSLFSTQKDENGQPLYDAGHVMAKTMGGSGTDTSNLVPMVSHVNRYVYGGVEHMSAKMLKNCGPDCKMEYKVKINYKEGIKKDYSANDIPLEDLIPESFEVEYTVKKGSKSIKCSALVHNKPSVYPKGESRQQYMSQVYSPGGDSRCLNGAW